MFREIRTQLPLLTYRGSLSFSNRVVNDFVISIDLCTVIEAATHIRTEPASSMFISYAPLISHFRSHPVVISQAMCFISLIAII
jgi:hypothetical protein